MPRVSPNAALIDDQTLRKYADRIQLRAIRRGGAMLKQVEPSKGGRPCENSGGQPPELTRTAVATDAGLSEHQRKTMLRVANVPESQLIAQVDGARQAGRSSAICASIAASQVIPPL